jgi:CDP-diacylglycerol--serine O-phosphatidyltransferase
MLSMRLWRYVLPNAITATSLIFAVLAVESAVAGQTLAASWFALYCVLTDKLDGFAARLVGGSSEFGVQFDSFADLAAFGIAPATIWYAYLSQTPALGFAAPGPLRTALQVAAVLYVLCVAFRLARFNVSAPVSGTRIYFGAPTTLMSGTLMSLFVTFLKYGQSVGFVPGDFGGPRLFGRAVIPVAGWQLWPVIMVAGGLLMVSGLKVPKLGLTPSRWANTVVLANIVGVYLFGAMRWLPEYLAWVGVTYLLVSIVWGQVVQAAREAVRPPLFAEALGQTVGRPSRGIEADDPEL